MNATSQGKGVILDPQALFERLFESSPDAIVVSDHEGRITKANAQAERIFGFTRDELLGRLVETLVPERFRDVYPTHRKEYSAAPHMRPMSAGTELYGLRKDGTEFPVEIMLSPVEGAEGRDRAERHSRHYGTQTGCGSGATK